ncbi:MAG: type II toxin-antitoxin system YafQ family toxin [Methylocella sp.]
MKGLRVSSAFRKDLKRIGRRGLDLSKLEIIVDLLRAGKAPPPQAKPHPLKGEWKAYWDCHIEPDWLLIYRVTVDEVFLARTGTHAGLFNR